jgi:tetratricopeptide (TPR) repeat protein
VADDIRALSELLAHDPGSLVYARLAEALRRRGDLSRALQVVMQGLRRHPEHVDGLVCLGRIQADRGDLAEARAAWARALAVVPTHGGALKGMAFGLFREGDARGATELLVRALAANPSDGEARRALDTVRRGEGPGPDAPTAPPPEPAARGPEPDQPGPTAFRGFEGATADILLFDDRGLVVAGGLTGAAGVPVSELAAAALAGVSGEAGRTAEYLALGGWDRIVAEADRANLVLAPVGSGALLLVRRDRSVPVGLAVRVAERAQAAARAWLERQGA